MQVSFADLVANWRDTRGGAWLSEGAKDLDQQLLRPERQTQSHAGGWDVQYARYSQASCCSDGLAAYWGDLLEKTGKWSQSWWEAETSAEATACCPLYKRFQPWDYAGLQLSDKPVDLYNDDRLVSAGEKFCATVYGNACKCSIASRVMYKEQIEADVLLTSFLEVMKRQLTRQGNIYTDSIFCMDHHQ